MLDWQPRHEHDVVPGLQHLQVKQGLIHEATRARSQFNIELGHIAQYLPAESHIRPNQEGMPLMMLRKVADIY
jgi:hypothetical protein